MVNVFGESVGSRPGKLQMVKKVVVTKGKYKYYTNEIRQSYDLGFTPFRLHTNTVGTYVLDDVTTMEIGTREIETDKISSKLVYFVEGDDGSGVALKGDSGDQGCVGSQGPAGKRGSVRARGPTGKIGKMGPVGSKGDVGARGEKGDKGDAGGIEQQGAVVPRGSTGPRCVQGAKGLRRVSGIQDPLGMKGPVCASCVKGERVPQGPYGIQGLLGYQADRRERGKRGERGEKGLQGDTSDVLSVFADHLPIHLATRYGEKCASSSIMHQRLS